MEILLRNYDRADDKKSELPDFDVSRSWLPDSSTKANVLPTYQLPCFRAASLRHYVKQPRGRMSIKQGQLPLSLVTVVTGLVQWKLVRDEILAAPLGISEL